ncbi:MAG: Mur ligase domain-containing protein, partial [Catalinimonas sp.]
MPTVNYYFLGIGGIGMSALARYFLAAGHRVGGYDRVRTPLTEALEREGADVHYDDRGGDLPAWVRAAPECTRVVLTPAVPADMGELVWLRAHSYSVQKRAQILGEITRNHFTVAVAGTHGKTTTTTMVAHLLRQAGRNVTAFLGGISVNYGTNLLLGDAGADDHVVVVEADEYDRSFLTLTPN